MRLLIAYIPAHSVLVSSFIYFGIFSRFSGDLYDIKSLSLDLLLACLSMLSMFAVCMVCLSFCLKFFFSYLLLFHVVGYIWLVVFFHMEVPWVFGLVFRSVDWHMLLLWILW